MALPDKIPAHLQHRIGRDTSKYNVPTGGAQFPRISLGKERFTAIDADNNSEHISNDEIEFIVIDSNPHTSKIYFETGYDPENPSMPDCFSDNGEMPDVRVAVPQSDYCHSCPMNAWGSEINPQTKVKRKACGDYKKVLVYLLGDVEGVYMFRISGASLKAWGNYLLKLANWKTGGAGINAEMVITRASWSDKQNVLKFEYVDFINADEDKITSKHAANPEYEQWIGVDRQSAQKRQLVSQRVEPSRQIEDRRRRDDDEKVIDVEPERVREPTKPRRASREVDEDRDDDKPAPRRSRGSEAPRDAKEDAPRSRRATEAPRGRTRAAEPDEEEEAPRSRTRRAEAEEENPIAAARARTARETSNGSGRRTRH